MQETSQYMFKSKYSMNKIDKTHENLWLLGLFRAEMGKSQLYEGKLETIKNDNAYTREIRTRPRYF